MRAGMVHKVVGCKTHLVAVVAEDLLHASRILCRKALSRQQRVQHLKVHRHVSDRPAAERARVVVPRVRRKADAVHEVAAREFLVRARHSHSTSRS